jgi:hypothetical protein
MALENWVVFNNMIVQKNAPKLSHVVLMIKPEAEPTSSLCLNLAMLASCVTDLNPQNFTVIFNKCEPNFTFFQAKEFFYNAVKTLDESA